MQEKTPFFKTITNLFKNTFNIKDKLVRRDFFIPAILYFIVIGIIQAIIAVTIAMTFWKDKLDGITSPDQVQTIINSNPEIVSSVAFTTFIVTLIVGTLLLIPIYTAMIRRFNDLGLKPKYSLILFVIGFILNYVPVVSILILPIMFIILILPTDFLKNKNFVSKNWLSE